MTNLWQSVLTSQFEAALATLGLCVQAAPEEVWNGKVAMFPFSQTAFHTLIFTDLYLETGPEHFREQPFHRANPELFGNYEQLEDVDPVCVYTKGQIKLYLDFCRAKAVRVLAAETEESLAAIPRFGRQLTRAEFHLYNLRHIQHHAAQLILRLRQESDVNIPWVGSSWRDS